MNGHPAVSNVFTWWNHHRRKSSGTSLPCLTEVTRTGCLIFCFQLLNVHLIQSISTYLSFFFCHYCTGKNETTHEPWTAPTKLRASTLFVPVKSDYFHIRLFLETKTFKGYCIAIKCSRSLCASVLGGWSPMQSFAHSCLRVVLVSCNQALCAVCELAPVTLEITLCKEFVFF